MMSTMLLGIVSATTHTVGGSSGWDVSSSLTNGSSSTQGRLKQFRGTVLILNLGPKIFRIYNYDICENTYEAYNVIFVISNDKKGAQKLPCRI